MNINGGIVRHRHAPLHAILASNLGPNARPTVAKRGWDFGRFFPHFGWAIDIVFIRQARD